MDICRGTSPNSNTHGYVKSEYSSTSLPSSSVGLDIVKVAILMIVCLIDIRNAD